MAEELKDLGVETPETGGDTSANAQASAEKMIPQSQANALIGQKRIEGYQKGFADAMAKVQSQSAPEAQVQQSGGMAQPSQVDIGKLVEEKLAQQNHEAARQQSINGFINKMHEGPSKYSDFENKVEKLNLPAIEPLVHLAGAVDNTADVVYDLAENPEKVAQLLTTLEKAPHIAFQQIQKLSSSIKANQAALKDPKVDEPLSHIKPSTVGMDNGSKTTDDWRNVDWLRG